jgi:hypothetical protein
VAFFHEVVVECLAVFDDRHFGCEGARAIVAVGDQAA